MTHGEPNRFAEGGTDLPAKDAMFDPELADQTVGAGEREAVRRLGMREERRIEVHANVPALGPVDPTLKILDANLIAIDAAAAELAVTGVQTQSMRTGNEHDRLIQVGAELVGRADLVGIIAGDSQSAAEFRTGIFDPIDIVLLPAV